MKYSFLILFSYVIVSCGTPPTLTPIYTPNYIFISYPTNLQPVMDLINQCANEDPTLAVFTYSQDSTQTNLPGPLLQLLFGESGVVNAYTYLIGEEELSFVVNSRNPVDSISMEEFLSIYTGQQEYWSDENLAPIQVWSYPQGNFLQSSIEAALPNTLRISQQARIAPDPQAVLEAVSNDTSAIGYVPTRWLASSATQDQLKFLSIDASIDEKLYLPVLITMVTPPSLQVQVLISCLQQSFQQLP